MPKKRLSKPVSRANDRPAAPSKLGGRKNISEARLAEALRHNGGCMAAAARSLNIKRQSVRTRVLRSEALKEAMLTGQQDISTVAVDHVMQKVWDGDDAMVRYYLDRRHPDFMPKRQQENVPPPPDPEAEKRRLELVRFFGAEIERRARAGLPPIFESNIDKRPPQIIDATPRKHGNGRANGHG